MIKYKKYKVTNTASRVYGMYFGRAIHELMEFDEFINHMAKHHCVFSEATIRGVLIEMETCLRELLLEGKAVRFDELGIFSLGIDNKKGGAESPDEYNANMIEGVHMNLYLGRRFRARNLYADAKFREADRYEGFDNFGDDSESPVVEP